VLNNASVGPRTMPSLACCCCSCCCCQQLTLLVHAARRWGVSEDVTQLLADAYIAVGGLRLPYSSGSAR
jgi:hypothetical protein